MLFQKNNPFKRKTWRKRKIKRIHGRTSVRYCVCSFCLLRLWDIVKAGLQRSCLSFCSLVMSVLGHCQIYGCVPIVGRQNGLSRGKNQRIRKSFKIIHGGELRHINPVIFLRRFLPYLRRTILKCFIIKGMLWLKRDNTGKQLKTIKRC